MDNPKEIKRWYDNPVADGYIDDLMQPVMPRQIALLYGRPSFKSQYMQRPIDMSDEDWQKEIEADKR